MNIESRPITKPEAIVIRTALRLNPTINITNELLDSIDTLKVVARCDCGCASVDFEKPDELSKTKPIANAIGVTPSRGEVGIIIWGTEKMIAGLEIYNLGAGDIDLVLPVPLTIRAC